MMRYVFSIVSALFIASTCFSQQVKVAVLFCENKVNPLGMEAEKPVFGWEIRSEQRGVTQTAYQVLVSDDAATFQNNTGNAWNSGRVESSESVRVRYAGKKLLPGKKYYWRVQIWDQQKRVSGWSETGYFVTGLYSQQDWSGARWIGYEEMNDTMRLVPGIHGPNRKNAGNKWDKRNVVPMFRRSFRVNKPVANAFAFISGLGHYEMTVNGKKAGNAFLAPGWTQYDKTVLYNVYDITGQLRNGDNAVGVITGNGFYTMNRERYLKLLTVFGLPKMICKIQVNYTDGTMATIISDNNWKAAPSPITYTSIYGGEDYDARLEQAGWDQGGVEEPSWIQALLVKPPQGALQSEKDYPLTVNTRFVSSKITEPEKGKYVYDFGQNASGIIELQVRGKKGDSVKLYPAELIHDNGLANQNATGKPFYFTYICKGTGIETWRPRFTYYGFRYVQVEGAAPESAGDSSRPAIVQLEALHTSNSAPVAGTFVCNNELFNRINHLINWAIKSNIQSVVTDCPHREKLGWLEQCYLMGEGIKSNLNVYHLYRKMVYDMIDAQTADGLVPDIAPEYVAFDGGFRDSPEWGSSSVIIPWLIYKWYGDKEIIRTAYPMMKKYVAYLQSRSNNHILSFGLGDWFDYGPGRPGYAQLTPIPLTATAIYYYDITLLAKMAALLNDQAELTRLNTMAVTVKKIFNDTFFNAQTKVYSTGSQTAMAMPLCVGLVDEKDRKAVMKNMVDSIEASGKKLTAGDVGFHFLVQALYEGGASQLLYDMNYRDDVPGYGFQLKKGATALTESWPALKEVSNNHLMLGHVMEWFYKGLAGIDQSEKSIAFKSIVIKPEIVGDLTYVKGQHQTPYGLVVSEWKKEGNAFYLHVQVPANTTALIYLPAKEGQLITESGAALNSVPQVKLLRYENGRALVLAGSGAYDFAVNAPARTRPGRVIERQASASIPGHDLYDLFAHPPASAKPWVFWYWMQAAYSKEGITADLEAMKEAGIGGAYLMPIKGPANPPLLTPVVEQLSPAWWAMVKHAMEEAKRLGITLSMHLSDGFALAGGPWITPELSMQKIVWEQVNVKGNALFNERLPQPETNAGYYRDIAVLAFPILPGNLPLPFSVVPKVTSGGIAAGQATNLLSPANKQSVRCDTSCWIQYEYAQPFTARSVVTRASGNNYQSHRFTIQVSDDGEHFRDVVQLVPPRHGWQDTDADVTHSLPATTGRFFRFIYNREGSEPGAEDLDAAKWKQSLKVNSIWLMGQPVINQYEGKSGAIWRLSRTTTQQVVPDSVCVRADRIIDITDKLSPAGILTWNVPPGNWTIIRMGHTSTGHTNATGGGGKGLECDKFNTEAIKLQFDRWFGEAIRTAGPELAAEVLKVLHIDSWECGSQNWSPVFREEFKKRRGYDLVPYLPVMAGIPIQSAAKSEAVLADVRQTIAELVKDKFYNTLVKLAKEKGCEVSAECVAPTMMSDGLLHYSAVDLPMGEFWLNSPTHDKPNDMLDAISGAHIYGKPIVQAEAFTTLRMTWDEHPGMLKTLMDRNYALGINKMVFHVFAQNPWLDRKPGMTLDGIGLYFQRDQTWWKSGAAWVQYAQRCQALLQQGKPVVDIGVFTGTSLPRRAVLPDRLVSTLPGIFGDAVVQSEKKRLANVGLPLRELPAGVTHSANMADPENWIDPLHGYAYDSFNPDALFNLATVKNKRVVLPGGASYGVLVFPDHDPLSGEKLVYPLAIENKIAALKRQGAVIVRGVYKGSSFAPLGIEKDLIAIEDGKPAAGIAWAHRRDEAAGRDIYFVSNQQDHERTIELSLRVAEKMPELFDAVTGRQTVDVATRFTGNRTVLSIQLPENGSLFIVLRKKFKPATDDSCLATERMVYNLPENWTVIFDTSYGGPVNAVQVKELESWTNSTNDSVKFYSGTAVYTQSIDLTTGIGCGDRIVLNVGKVNNLAEVIVNGIDCGVAWTAPYEVDITKALRPGKNELVIKVTNTWFNRLVGDLSLPVEKRRTWTTAPLRMKDKPLQPAGLLGPVVIMKNVK